jgi:tetratricopeptide (TPR) repeat protein
LLQIAIAAALLAIGPAAAEPPVAAPPKPAPPPGNGRDEVIESAGRLLIAGKTNDAYELLRAAAITNPALPPPRLMLWRLYGVAMRRQPGFDMTWRSMLDQAIAESPDHPLVYLERAGVALADGHYAEAVLDCEKALKLNEDPRWTADQRRDIELASWYKLTTVAERRRDWAAAREHLNRLIEAEPKNGRYRERLGRALFHLNELDEAVKQMTLAAKLAPELDPPAVQVAKLWSEKDESARAREWFEKAVHAEPNNLRTRLAFAEWLIQRKELSLAKAEVDAAAEITPDHPRIKELRKQIANPELPKQDRLPNEVNGKRLPPGI